MKLHTVIPVYAANKPKIIAGKRQKGQTMEEIKNSVTRLGDQQAEQVTGGGGTNLYRSTAKIVNGPTNLFSEPKYWKMYIIPDVTLNNGDAVTLYHNVENDMEYVCVEKCNIRGWVFKSYISYS